MKHNFGGEGGGGEAITTIYHYYLQCVIVTEYIKKLNISIDYQKILYYI